MHKNKNKNAPYQHPKIIYYSRHHGWILPESINNICCRLNKLLRWLSIENIFYNPVELYLVDDFKIAKFNRKFFNCSGPTNILSFPASVGQCGVLLLSLPTYQRECRLYHQKPIYYLYFLLTHGIAHLNGMEHGPVFNQFQNQCLNYLDL